MPKSNVKEKKHSYRFTDETIKQLDKCVAIKKREHKWWDRTKFLEWAVDLFSRGKLKEVK